MDSVIVTILNRSYKLKVAPEEATTLQVAADMVNAKAEAYSKRYTYQDNQDLLSMVGLTLMNEQLSRSRREKAESEALIEKLTTIDDLLTEQIEYSQSPCRD